MSEVPWGAVEAGVRAPRAEAQQRGPRGIRSREMVARRLLPEACPGSLLAGQEETRQHRPADGQCSPGLIPELARRQCRFIGDLYDQTDHTAEGETPHADT